MTAISDADRAEAQAMAEAFHGGALAAPSNNVRQWLAVRDHVLAAHECPSTDRRALGYYRHPRMDGQTECPECGYLMHEHGWLDTGGDGIVVCPSLHGPFGGQAVTDHARNHTCPDAESDPRVQAWNITAKHPLFSDCYSAEGALVDAMLAKLDVAHTHTCQPAWRPTTFEEIQPGWEVRSRRPDGSEAGWGTAHHRDHEGDWRTEAETILTFSGLGWTYETTAPMPEPEPWDDDTLDEWEDSLRASIDLDAGWTTSTRQLLDLLAERGLIERPKAGA